MYSGVCDITSTRVLETKDKTFRTRVVRVCVVEFWRAGEGALENVATKTSRREAARVGRRPAIRCAWQTKRECSRDELIRSRVIYVYITRIHLTIIIL